MLEEAIERSPTATELAPPLAATYAQLGRRQEARDMLLRWKPGASQEELSDIALAYPYTYRWSADGQKALDRLIDGMIIAALPLDVTVPSSPTPCSRVAPSSARMRQGRWPVRPAGGGRRAGAGACARGPQPRRAQRGDRALGKIGPKAKAAIPALAAIRDDRIAATRGKRSPCRNIVGDWVRRSRTE